MVSYFATWCAPCRIGLAEIERIASARNDVMVVYIGLGERQVAPVSKMVDDLHLKHPVVLDKFKVIGARHGVFVEGVEITLPKTFVLDSSGIVQAIFTVEGDDFATQLVRYLP